MNLYVIATFFDTSTDINRHDTVCDLVPPAVQLSLDPWRSPHDAPRYVLWTLHLSTTHPQSSRPWNHHTAPHSRVLLERRGLVTTLFLGKVASDVFEDHVLCWVLNYLYFDLNCLNTLDW